MFIENLIDTDYYNENLQNQEINTIAQSLIHALNKQKDLINQIKSRNMVNIEKYERTIFKNLKQQLKKIITTELLSIKQKEKTIKIAISYSLNGIEQSQDIIFELELKNNSFYLIDYRFEIEE